MDYPAVSFHFRVEFHDLEGATDNDVRFQEVSGLDAELSTEELKEGGENRFTHRLPQPSKYSNLVLKRGLMTDSGLIGWFRDAIESFVFEPRMVSVTLLDEESNALMAWNFVNAYPLKWSVSNLDANKNEVVVDTVELAYQHFTKRVPDSQKES